MITEKSKNLIREEMLNLPKEVQDATNASGWEKVSEEIGKKYLLDENEINTFQLETASLLLGLVDEDSYPINIEDEIGISKEEAKKIAEEVFQKIFTPISNSIEEAVKNNLKNKNPNPAQTLDFILSGGDYSAFIAPTEVGVPTGVGKENTNIPVAPPSLADIKANVQTGAGKMEDMKRKFTI